MPSKEVLLLRILSSKTDEDILKWVRQISIGTEPVTRHRVDGPAGDLIWPNNLLAFSNNEKNEASVLSEWNVSFV